MEEREERLAGMLFSCFRKIILVDIYVSYGS